MGLALCNRIKPRVMTRGSEANVKPKARDETHSNKMIKLQCQKEAHTKRASFCCTSQFNLI